MKFPLCKFWRQASAAAIFSLSVCSGSWSSPTLAAEPGAIIYVNGQWVRSGGDAQAPRPSGLPSPLSGSALERTARANSLTQSPSWTEEAPQAEASGDSQMSAASFETASIPPVISEPHATLESVSFAQPIDDGAGGGTIAMEGSTCAADDGLVDYCYDPPWTIWADLLFLQRSDGPGLGLVFSDGFLGIPGNPGPAIFTGRELDPSHRVAPRLGISRCLNECYSWDVSGWWIDNLVSRTSFTTPFHVAFPGFIQAYIPPLTGTGTFVSGTDLYTLEANLRRESDSWYTLLAGFRWIEVHDELQFQFQPTAGANSAHYLIDTNNHLYGVQVGLLGNLWNGQRGWRVDFWGKAGIYHNEADQSTNVFFPAVGSTADRDDDAAFVADLGLTATRQLTDGLALRLGYQFLWIDGLALAPNQLLGVNDVTVPISVLDTGGSLTFDGAFVGLEATW